MNILTKKNNKSSLTELEDISTFFFVDETKFSKNNEEPEDAIFYIAISVNKNKNALVQADYNKIMVKYSITKGFHATKQFKKKNPNKDLMFDLCNLIINHKLMCYCYKYSKTELFEAGKIVYKNFNNDIMNFKSYEFQALFFFIQAFQKFLQNENNFIPKGLIFFDRNVYGQNDIEGFDFEESKEIRRMIFLSKKKIKLLGLPDYFGCIFRNSKLSKNKVEFGDKSLEKSELVINSYYCLIKISESNLFRFVEW